jgi:hypothetical protein
LAKSGISKLKAARILDERPQTESGLLEVMANIRKCEQLLDVQLLLPSRIFNWSSSRVRKTA